MDKMKPCCHTLAVAVCMTGLCTKQINQDVSLFLMQPWTSPPGRETIALAILIPNVNNEERRKEHKQTQCIRISWMLFVICGVYFCGVFWRYLLHLFLSCGLQKFFILLLGSFLCWCCGGFFNVFCLQCLWCVRPDVELYMREKTSRC